ncbi:MAG: hypothetical protein ABI670_04255 [Chloroflexota bacterium]
MSAELSLAPWPVEWQADTSFYNLWSRADGPLASGSVARSWLWGPQPFAVANEEYAESVTGKRLVEYLDKGRMEINDPAADRSSAWFVTSGLLVNEMVTGSMQSGNSQFEVRAPAAVAVAGDAASPNAPTYASFANHTMSVASSIGQPVAQLIDKDGTISSYAAQNDPGLLNVAYFDAESGHNVPAVFADWSGKSGTVIVGGRLVTEQLLDPLFVLGHPITEAYWANVLVEGKPATVLMQLFERRALTYNPVNPEYWRVEMANVGRAYYDWRYGSARPGPAIAGEVEMDAVSVAGWHWRPSTQIQVAINEAATSAPPAASADLTTDASGRFRLQVPLDQSLRDMLQSGAKLRLSAVADEEAASLPLVGKPEPSGSKHLEGLISHVEIALSGTILTVTTMDGRQWPATVTAGTVITFGEGGSAKLAAMDVGVSVVLDGNLSRRTISASRIVIMSASHTAARIGYAWSTDGASLNVVGTGWPGGRDVRLALGKADDAQPPPFVTLHSDSRANLTEIVKPPAGIDFSAADMWLFAQSVAGDGTRVQIAVPLATLGNKESPAPMQLFLASSAGAQAGGTGSYCTAGKCLQAAGAVLPSQPLTVKPGEVVGLRTQTGANPLLAPSATPVSAQLYTYPLSSTDPYFVPQGAPLLSTATPSGRPFSVALPNTLASGRYVLVVSVTWPDSGAGVNNGIYAFCLQVP